QRRSRHRLSRSGGTAGFGRSGEGADLSGAADETALLARLPRAVPFLRQQSEHRSLSLRADRLNEPPQKQGASDAESETTTLEGAKGPAAHARRAGDPGHLRGPAVPRGQASSPGLPPLRLLQGPRGDRGQERLMSVVIALDAMGGDHAPASVVEGAVMASRRFG